LTHFITGVGLHFAHIVLLIKKSGLNLLTGCKTMRRTHDSIHELNRVSGLYLAIHYANHIMN
ncbi:hypothetical protein, partial [Klebsiella pneumoniae]|uniref:hypothetical protein n=1 Tax=Klebsiella pneumoniae TaxID=573 RepID=UPI001EDD48B8